MLTKSQRENAPKNRILVVDDDDAIRHMYSLKLTLKGYEVAVAVDGNEGLKVAEVFKPHLMLLDLKMPHLGGYEMLERVRATEWGADIRVIILTNLGKEEATRGLFLLGVKRYIVKAHHTPSQVAEMVTEVLGY